jgi:hypothetical protein
VKETPKQQEAITMDRYDRPFVTTSFGLVLWLTAKGYEPYHAKVTTDHGVDRVTFMFSPAARDAVSDFYPAKERLNQLSTAARNEHNINLSRSESHHVRQRTLRTAASVS